MRREALLRSGVESPTVYISLEAYIKVRQLVDQCDKEIGWFGAVERSGEEYQIYDIFVFDQDVHETETDIDAASIGKVVHELYEQGKEKEVNELNFWGHSHVNMACNPSGQDKSQALEFAEDNPNIEFMICGIFNKKGEIRIDLYDYKNREAWLELPIKLGTPELISNIRAEMAAEIKEHVKYVKHNSQSGNIRSYGAARNSSHGWNEQDAEEWEKAYGGYDSWYGRDWQSSRVSTYQARNTGHQSVGQGSGGAAQRSEPVVQAGTSGTQQGGSTPSEHSGNQPDSKH